MKMMQRGQALIETAAFLPVLLLTMLSIVYFSQYGVLQTRAVEAVRYASLVSNGSKSSASSLFSLEAMYAEMSREGSSPLPAAPPLSPVGDLCTSGSAATDAKNALTMQQTSLTSGSAPAPAPSYFKPDSTPTTLCSEIPIALGTPSSANVDDFGDYYFTVQVTTLYANKSVPGIVRSMTRLTSLTTPVNAADGYPMPPSTARTIYCSPNFSQTLASSLGADRPSAASKYAMPTPGSYPTMRPGC
jgi:hypothetical protein